MVLITAEGYAANRVLKITTINQRNNLKQRNNPGNLAHILVLYFLCVSKLSNFLPLQAAFIIIKLDTSPVKSLLKKN